MRHFFASIWVHEAQRPPSLRMQPSASEPSHTGRPACPQLGSACHRCDVQDCCCRRGPLASNSAASMRWAATGVSNGALCKRRGVQAAGTSGAGPGTDGASGGGQGICGAGRARHGAVRRQRSSPVATQRQLFTCGVVSMAMATARASIKCPGSSASAAGVLPALAIELPSS